MRLARWLVALPFLGILIGTAFVNQVEPLVLGMPFVLAWIVGWVVVGAAAMALVYATRPAQRRPRGRRRRRAPMNAALVIIGLATLGALALGLAAHRGVRMTLEQWTVAGRGFGGLLVFLLTAGEIYTTFTFLGGSGWAYGRGAPTFYILAYGSLAYFMSYWLLPPIWRYAKRERLLSQPHFFSHKYDSPWLGVLVAAVGVVALVPYLVLQFQGLGIIVSVASYGSISPTLAIWIGAATVTIYVMISGMHGVAWNAAVKDALILVVVVFLGIYLPLHYYGGIGAMFRAIDAAKPGFLAFKPTGQSVLWFQSTVS